VAREASGTVRRLARQSLLLLAQEMQKLQLLVLSLQQQVCLQYGDG
jgi:hypothetical protein